MLSYSFVVEICCKNTIIKYTFHLIDNQILTLSQKKLKIGLLDLLSIHNIQYPKKIEAFTILLGQNHISFFYNLM